MSTPHDDPRLTAYALNELNATDRAAVEQQIGNSIETLLEIEAIRQVAGQLRAALREETPAGTSIPARNTNDGFEIPRLTAPLTADHSLAHRAESSPHLASAGDDFSPRGKFSGKFAVTASCLALAGAFGIVAITDHGERPTIHELARESGRLVWYDLAMTERSGPITDDEATPLNLERKSALQELGVDPTSPRNLNRDFSSKAGEGVAPSSPSFGGLGGFDVSSVGNGPAVRGSGGGAAGGGEGFGGRGTGSRPAMLASGGGTLNAAEKLARRKTRTVTPESGLPSGFTPRFGLVPTSTASQPNRPDRLESLPGVLAGGRGLPVDVAFDDSKKLSKHTEDRRLGELKEQLSDLSLREHLEQDGAEAYAAIHDNPFAAPLQEPLSTFSIDVDTAAYSNMRRFLTQGSLPPANSVRIEELVNYFNYDYAPPGAEISNLKSQIPNQDIPFAVHMEVAGCPWNAEHRLVRVGLKGKEIALDKRPVSNIVFLIDVSGSMQDPNKLPLVKAGLRRLIEQFTENDRVGIVVYAGASGLALDSTNATQKNVILSSIQNLQAGGSTNGGEGIQLAYALARKHFIEKGTNRVILCTDGDFNVGITNRDDLTRLIEEESKSGVFLSVLGFGMGNLKDSTLEKLADKGNGNYAYIDTLREANKVFVEQMTGTLITIAKDVKIQIEFNPSQVGAYRLIGYENRLLAAQDFHDDTKDAGEIGAGHTVTALYEIIPPSKLPAPTPAIQEKLKYQPAKESGVFFAPPKLDAASEAESSRREKDSRPRGAANELLTIKLRYKQPDADKSSLIEMPLSDDGRAFAKASTDFRFAASVASFGMILRHSPHRGNATLDAVAEIAQSSLGVDKSGYRSEFVGLVRSAKALQK